MIEKNEIEARLSSALRSAVGGYRSEYSDARREALDRYLGEPYPSDAGLAPGRQSRFLDRTGFDTVELILPKLIKIFHSSNEAVKFTASGGVSDEEAQQQTDLCNFCYNVENEGFLISYDAIKSGLIEGISIAMVRWEEKETEQSSLYQGLSQEQLAFLATDPEIEVSGIKPQADGTLSVQLTRRAREGRCVVERVLSEEFRYDGEARSLAECNFLARIWPVSRGSLIARGFDRETIERANVHFGGYEEILNSARRRSDYPLSGNALDPSAEYVTYGEAWLRADLDEDGREEWTKFAFVGPDQGLTLLSQEQVDDQPFVVCSPIPIPGALEGIGLVESVREIQNAKTDVVRTILDGLYTRANPRLQVPISESMAFDDLFSNSDPGAPVRVINPGAIQPISDGYDPSPAYQLVQLLDQLRELRSGVSQVSAGTDANILRTQTATAIEAAQSAAAERIELIIRIYAETFFKPLFRKILRLFVQNQDRPRVISVRGRSVEVDPRAWQAEAALSVTVGLGTGRKSDAQAAQLQLLTMMRELAQAGSRLVNEQTIYRALIDYVKTLEIGSPESYFVDPASLPEPIPSEPQPDPLVLAEQMRARGGLAREQAKTQRDITIERIRDDRARDKDAQDLAIKIADIFGVFDPANLQGQQAAPRYEDEPEPENVEAPN